MSHANSCRLPTGPLPLRAVEQAELLGNYPLAKDHLVSPHPPAPKLPLMIQLFPRSAILVTLLFGVWVGLAKRSHSLPDLAVHVLLECRTTRRWTRPELTLDLAQRLVEHLGARRRLALPRVLDEASFAYCFAAHVRIHQTVCIASQKLAP